MPEPDLDDILADSTPLVCVVDQRPFVDKASTFCVLAPVMTIDGDRFAEPERAFPNRGRIWWMLHPEHTPAGLGTGMLVTCEIERAIGFDERLRLKDRYQARRASIREGAGDWIEVLDLPLDSPDMHALLGTEGIPLARKPLDLVVLRSRTCFVGPLSAVWDRERHRAWLSAVNRSELVAYRLPLTASALAGELREFAVRVEAVGLPEGGREIGVRLLRKSALKHFQQGEPVDAAGDADIVSWAIKAAKLTRAEKTHLREALTSLAGSDIEGPLKVPGRLERFRRICESAERTQGLGAEIAQQLAEAPGLRALVQEHADALATKEVEKLVAERRAGVEREVTQLTEQRDRLKREIARIEGEYDRRKSEQETRLEAEHAAWLERLAARERELEESRKALAEQEQGIASRLAAVLHAYGTRSRELGDEVVALLPLLRRVWGEADPRSPAEPRAETAGRLALPSWLDAVPKKPAEITREADLVAQFENVVSRRACVFAREDLIAFHVAVKTGLWTVLAGPSGIGKSLLPRLYAEALGASDEFLTVPVRPDWLDDRDVIGAYNALSGRFEPAANGLVDRLIAAAEDAQRGRGGIFLVCLDEMNLARVEHYFAQFLSVLEEPSEERRLRLFSAGLERAGDPYAPWRHLPLADNLRFVGTVNVDETTHFFSPKVIDRTQVVTFGAPDLSRPPARAAKARDLGVRSVDATTYKSWVRGPEAADPAVRGLLVELDRPLRELRCGLGFRVRDRVLAYVASAADLLPADSALDFALAQNIVPRIRAAHAGAGETLDRLCALVPRERFPRAGALLQALRESEGAHEFFQLL